MYNLPVHQPLGEVLVPQWTPRLPPAPTHCSEYMTKHCFSKGISIQPLSFEEHSMGLHQSFHCKGKKAYLRLFTYMLVSPPDNLTMFQAWITRIAAKQDPMFFAIVANDSHGNPCALASVDEMTPFTTRHKVEPSDHYSVRAGGVQPLDAVGMFSLMRCDPNNGSIEIGGVLFSPRLQQTRQATEAVYLAMRYVFEELRYRRFEWKCNNLNEPSKKAALRYGFNFEGVFRNHLVVKGRNRDTAWFAIIESEYFLYLREAFEQWLAASNFDSQGKQKRALGEIIGETKRRKIYVEVPQQPIAPTTSVEGAREVDGAHPVQQSGGPQLSLEEATARLTAKKKDDSQHKSKL